MVGRLGPRIVSTSRMCPNPTLSDVVGRLGPRIVSQSRTRPKPTLGTVDIGPTQDRAGCHPVFSPSLCGMDSMCMVSQTCAHRRP